MQGFTRLFLQLDRTTRTSEKVRALTEYFTHAPPHDAAWALFFLTGRRIKRAVSTTLLREWVAEATGLPAWLIDESYDAVGDLAEALALLLGDRGPATSMGLAEFVSARVIPLTGMPPEQQRSLIHATWQQLDADQRLVWHKLVLGEFRVGVARTLVARAMAGVAGVPPAVMSHRLMGHWEPTAGDYNALVEGEQVHANPGRPYPFFLAHPLESDPPLLGDLSKWQAEWKWDGIRAQLIRRQGQVLVWSRGEELITDRFPEVRAAGLALEDGTVLDGEILAWRDDQPLPFALLQRRIGRKTVTSALMAQAPVIFMAFDILEHRGQDIREQPLVQRRQKLENLPVGPALPLRVSPTVLAGDWREYEHLRHQSRQRQVEGLMFKRKEGPYGVGRPRGEWWKWKTLPYSLDAVLIYAQRGHGRRASLYTDYTFGVWRGSELVPIAKAYSGLSDAEIREVDRFVRQNTLERFGPVRVVKPELVFELHFEAVQVSKRHKAGLAVRFPRMARWRIDKRPEEADTLDALRRLAGQPPE